MDDWVVWLLIAAGLLVAEVLTLTYVLGLIGLAAVLAAGFAYGGASVAVQLVAFAAAGAALGFGVAPIARRHRREPEAVRMGVAALEGQSATVTTEVTATTGRVTLGGESWAARAVDPSIHIAAGTQVSVASVDGATLVIYEQDLT